MTIRVMKEVDWEFLKRKHIQSLDWADAVGTDYWLVPGEAVAGATTFLLSSRGWTTTAMSLTAGAAADFASYADRGDNPRIMVFGASGDLVSSPIIFGDYMGAKGAALLMGRSDLPRYLVADVYGAFTTASANENTSGFGFVEDGGAITTAADQLAVIVSDGTNFICRSGADSDTGALISTTYHWWRIMIDGGLGTNTDAVSWYIDGVNQGTLDLEADEFPVHFAAHSLTTNRLGLSTVHIYYAWDRRYVDLQIA